MKKLYILIFITSISSATFAQVPSQQWGFASGGPSGEQIEASCTDPSGNYYIAGSFDGTVDFDPSGGTASRSTTVAGTTDAFIAKFNPAGQLQWVTTFGGSESDGIYGIAADASGVYVTGFFAGTADFDPVGTTTKIAVDDYDIFVAKYNVLNGNLLFVTSFGSSGTDYGNAITVNGNSIYVTGAFHDVIDFDPSVSSDPLTSLGETDVFLASYTVLGDYQWAINIGSSDDDEGYAVVTNGSSVWVAGNFEGTFYPDPNDGTVSGDAVDLTDGFLSEYDVTAGTWKSWATIQSTGNDVIISLALDGRGGLYTAGRFDGNVVMYGANSTSKVSSSFGNLDNFVSRYDISTRQLSWLNTFGSTQDDYLTSIVADAGSVYAVGAYGGLMDIDPSATTTNLAFTGNQDAFFVKYNYLGGAYVTGFGLGGNDIIQARSIALGLGNIYYSGAFRGTVDIDPSGLTNSKSSGTDTAFDFFFSKYVPVEPFSSPGTISISNTGSTTATITLNALGGNYNDGYIVLYNIGSGVTATPVDNIVYNREDNPGNGVGKALITSGATVFTVTGLTPSSFYNISVFSYNGNASVSGNINYKTSIPITTTFTTSAVTAEPTGSPSNFNASAFTTSGYNVTFNAAVPAPTGYIAIRGAGVGTTPTTDPSDGVTYTVGSTIGNATVAYIGSALNFNETTLAFATTYNYKIYAYSGGGLTINYKQTSPAQGSTGTLGSLEPTAQPTNLVFTTETSTGYHYSFSASIGTNVSGYVGFRHLGSKPTFVPTDGVPLVAGDNADDGSFIAFFGTDLGFNAAGLTPSTTYYYSIYAFNGSGTTINYRQALPLKGNVTTTAFDDTTAPSISDKTPTSTTLSGGVTISVTATDNESGIDYLWVEYYPVNTDDYGDDDLESQGNDAYSFAIPASFNKGQGIEYKVHALDLAGNEAETQWKTIVLNVTDGLPIPYAFGTGKTNYRIISVPLNLANPKVTDVFDEFGTTYDKSKYRLFHFAGSNVTELTGTSTIELGKGYWFIAAEQKTVNSGAGTTVVTGIDKDVTIPIASGWNQIGNPYNFDVDWSDVVTANSDKTFTKYKTYEGGFNNGTSIKKMGGGFVMVSGVGDSQLVIPVYSSSRIAAPIPPNFNQTIDSDIWGVDLIVKSGDTENNFAGFGMHPDATEQADKFDDFTLPRFMDYLELNYNKKLFGSAYTKDIVPTSTQHVWEFELASNIDSDVIQVSWDNSNFENSALQLVLWDVNQQRAVDMKAQNRYSIDRSQSGKFKIFYGSESFVKQETLPNMAVFHSASPVPSSGSVTLAFSVPDSNGEVKTNLSIYNSMGQKVSKLVDDTLPAGYHQAVWNIEDGTKPAAGVYISVLKFGETTLQRRLIIK